MYTGIVQAAVPVSEVLDAPGLRSFVLELPQELLQDLAIGASVGVDGVCLTVTAIDGRRVSFDAMQETQDHTTLVELTPGDRVNVERSAKAGDEMGGHEISGHVDGTARIVSVEQPENNWILTFEAPADAMGYIFGKGFIALNGASLTVADVDRETNRFTVHLIPETLRITTFGDKKPGDRINFEIDRRTQVIVDTVRSFLEEQARSGALADLATASS